MYALQRKITREDTGKELLFKYCMSSSCGTFLLDEYLCVFSSGTGSAFFRSEQLQSMYNIKDAIWYHQNLALLVLLSSVEKSNLGMTLWYGFASITSLYFGLTTHLLWVKAANLNSVKQHPVLLSKQEQRSSAILLLVFVFTRWILRRRKKNCAHFRVSGASLKHEPYKFYPINDQ